MGEFLPSAADLAAVPLFPLPNVVLFPGAILPLHIFEERYKEMTADVLAGNRQLAMALLKPGWEKEYHHRPAIEPVVCVGTIVAHEKFPTGEYNFLLQGHTRARVKREFGDKSYRLAEVVPLEVEKSEEGEYADERRSLVSAIEEGTLLATDLGRKFRELLASSLPTPLIADLIAFKFLDDVPAKQSLLAECHEKRRVSRIVKAFAAAHPALQPAPSRSRKPSLN